jgi:hypothetical protein
MDFLAENAEDQLAEQEPYTPDKLAGQQQELYTPDKLAAVAAVPAVQTGCQELTLCISKPPGASLGVDLDIHENALPQVCGIDAGGIADAYNRSLEDGDRHLQVGDFIVSVNGAGLGIHKVLKTIKESADLEIRVRRPAAFSVRVEREEARNLGICINYAPNSASLLICKVVQGGEIYEHNLKWDKLAVQPMDRVVSINGVASEGDVGGLLKQMYEAKTLDMVLVRPGD